MSAVRATGLIVATLLFCLAGCVRPPAEHPAFEDPPVTSASGADEPLTAEGSAGEGGAFPLDDIPPAANAALGAGDEELPTDTDITDFAESEPAEGAGSSAAGEEPSTSVAAPVPAAAEDAPGAEGRAVPAGGDTTAVDRRPQVTRPAGARPRSRAPGTSRTAVAKPRPAAPRPDDDLERKAREVKARRGKQFADPKWQREFRDEGWYQPNPDYSDAHLSPTEREELKRIRKQQNERGGRAAR